MIHRAENIYSLALYRKSLLPIALNERCSLECSAPPVPHELWPWEGSTTVEDNQLGLGQFSLVFSLADLGFSF